MGIFQSLVDKYKDAKQRSLHKQEFKDALYKAAQDGRLTQEEIAELDKKRIEYGLTEDDVKGIRADVFVSAFNATKADSHVTAEEEIELLNIQKYLGLAETEIEPTKKELARLRLLNEIQNGNMPVLPPTTNLILQKGETVYWTEPATLAEEKVIRRSYQGGSSGVSFRIMKGVSYRVGSSRGHIVSETGMVPVSEGDVVITSKRVIFRGDNKSFATKLDNILDIQLAANGIRFSENNKSKPRWIKFKEAGNHDIVGAVMSHAINTFEPTSTSRKRTKKQEEITGAQ